MRHRRRRPMGRPPLGHHLRTAHAIWLERQALRVHARPETDRPARKHRRHAGEPHDPQGVQSTRHRALLHRRRSRGACHPAEAHARPPHRQRPPSDGPGEQGLLRDHGGRPVRGRRPHPRGQRPDQGDQEQAQTRPDRRGQPRDDHVDAARLSRQGTLLRPRPGHHREQRRAERQGARRPDDHERRARLLQRRRQLDAHPAQPVH